MGATCPAHLIFPDFIMEKEAYINKETKKKEKKKESEKKRNIYRIRA
jgi:hypothetical protein